MEKIKLQIIIMIALMLIGMAIWIYPVFKKISAPRLKIKEYAIMEDIVPIENFFKRQEILEEKRPKLILVRDPFQLPSKEIITEFTVESLKLSGIATDERGKLAIINDEIVREGDIIFGIKILKITEDKVIVEKEGEEYTLKIF